MLINNVFIYKHTVPDFWW